ncbi:hypothetical protein Q7P37_010236 [Cladosporium fusiforme]
MPPNISSRAFIQWLPDGSKSEPTSTLVLTSSKRHFVDIRIHTATGSPQQNTIQQLQSPGMPVGHAKDWAFAGTSASTTISTAEGGDKVYSQWHHWVDSKTSKPEDVVDKGEMLPEDTTTGISLEKGDMVNPDTGHLTEYIEGWRDVKPRPVISMPEMHLEMFIAMIGTTGQVIQGLESAERSAGSVSAVLRHEDASKGSRGMIVRVGNLCQGVLRMGEKFGYERWIDEGENPAEPSWKPQFLVGELAIPCCLVNTIGERMGTNTKLKFGEKEGIWWECIEAERF